MSDVAVAQVGIEARVGGIDAIYTYRAIEGLEVGQAVVVPLGSRQVLGIVLALDRVPVESLEFDASKLKSVAGIVRDVKAPGETIGLLHFVAQETVSPLSQVISLVVPPGLRRRLSTEWRYAVDAPALKLSAVQVEALRVLCDQGGVLVERPGKPMSAALRRAMLALRAKGAVTSGLVVEIESGRRAASALFRLTANEDEVERFLKISAKKKPAQCLAIMRLQAADRAGLSSAEIKLLSGISDQGLRALQHAGMIESSEMDERVSNPPKTLNLEQSAALEPILQAVDDRCHRSFLLFGITGSGKTEVYMHAAARALALGRKVLFIVPEIALTAQVIAQLRGRFGRRVAVLHSNLAETERIESWLRIARGDVGLVVGTRSALFAPLENLGLIIMDEEHETSYKQDAMPRYHAKPVALELGRLHDAPVVLGSATPSIETYYEALGGSHQLLKLTKRVAEAKLPTVEVVDLSDAYHQGKPSVLSTQLTDHLERCLQANTQAILFLNRRAYSPVLLCRECGENFLCPNCAVALAYHRRECQLKCHHCDHRMPLPDVCPACGGSRVLPLGLGVERIEEFVAERFPQAAVARLDRDIGRKKGAIEEIFARLRSGEIDILVGTQMVAKGLDFPRVALVGVVVADVGLNLPDFRAAERTFQLLAQVSGRAGRGDIPGHVVIQTFNPENEAIRKTANHDFEGFYEAVIEERRKAKYPPFVRLVNILIFGKDKSAVQSAAEQLKQRVEALFSDAVVLGPADCALERLAGNWRMHVLLKLPLEADVAPLSNLITDWRSASTTVAIDVNPYSLM